MQIVADYLFHEPYPPNTFTAHGALEVSTVSDGLAYDRYGFSGMNGLRLTIPVKHRHETVGTGQGAKQREP